MNKQEEIRVAEFKVSTIKYIGNMPVVVYEATAPAELYTIPVGYVAVEPLIKEE